MIRGLDLFREYFADYRKAFVLIGGVACHEWLSTQGLAFRATKDMDMVLIVEALDAAFVKRLWEFIEAGKYQGVSNRRMGGSSIGSQSLKTNNILR
jgi:hypothetical protein